MKRSFRMITLKQILLQICLGNWFMSLDLKDAYFHIQIAPPSQTILEIRIRRGGLSIPGPVIWAVPGCPHFYMMHGCGYLPSETDGNPYTQLPRWLAHFGPVAGGFDITQDPPPQPLRLPGAQGQLCQERTVTQPTSIVPGYSYRLADDSYCLSGASHLNSASRGILQGRLGSSSSKKKNLLHVETEGSSSGLASRMVTRACVQPWPVGETPSRLKRVVTLDKAHRRKVVTTDASNKGWGGALCEGKSTFGLWSEEESTLYINCLEMLAVCQVCQFFLPDIPCPHHVLVRSDSRSMVSYINHQGGLVSKRLCMLVNLKLQCCNLTQPAEVGRALWADPTNQ